MVGKEAVCLCNGYRGGKKVGGLRSAKRSQKTNKHGKQLTVES